jgi:predicted chitinase
MKAFLLLILLSFIVADEVYIVKSGDCLSAIAAKYGVTVAQLQQWNNIKNPNYIQIGQRIVIKKGSTPSTPDPQPQPSGSYTVTDSQMRRMGWKNYNLNDLNRCLKTFKITTKLRIRHFIAQTSFESGLGQWTEELGGPSYCAQYEYAARLGNTQPGDGCKFKGAGYIQLTGRYNYQQFSNYIGDSRVMEGCKYVASNYPWTSAGFWWHNNNMNSLCDSSPSVETVTRRVNGGTRGLAERQQYYQLACSIF